PEKSSNERRSRESNETRPVFLTKHGTFCVHLRLWARKIVDLAQQSSNHVDATQSDIGNTGITRTGPSERLQIAGAFAQGADADSAGYPAHAQAPLVSHSARSDSLRFHSHCRNLRGERNQQVCSR